MFKLLGVFVGLYTVYAVVAGQVYAKAGPGGRRIFRSESPEYFWTVIAIYAGLAGALLFYF